MEVDGFAPDTLAIVGGTNYQANHNFSRRLCDFIIFGDDGRRFVSAVELKGGANLDAKEAFEQIRNGLGVAAEHVDEHDVLDWFPLLLHEQVNLRARHVQFLNSNRVEFRGELKRIRVVPCVSQLSPIVNSG